MINDTPKIIEEIAAEKGIPASQVRKAVASQHQFTAHIIRKEEFETVHLQYLGKFTVHKLQLQRIKRLEAEGKTKRSQSNESKDSKTSE